MLNRALHHGLTLLTAGFSLASALAATPAPRSTAELLVDVARDYGLQRMGRQTPADVDHVAALLEAALRLDSRQPQACSWLYEIAALRDEPQRAAQYLTRLLAADPTNEFAFARWLELGLQAQQTHEQRIAWLNSVDRDTLPPALQAMIAIARARLALEDLDRDAARDYVQQARALDPTNVDAAALAVHLLPADASPATQLTAALSLLQLQPTVPDASWRVALVLEQAGQTAAAERFFNHTVHLYESRGGPGQLPGALRLDLARHYLYAGQLVEALAATDLVIRTDPQNAAAAGLLQHYLLSQLGRDAEAQKVQAALARRFAQIREPAEFPVNEVTQAAWFYCTIEPQPDRALMLARNAAERAPSDPFVQRVYGWALLQTGQTDTGRNTLEPLIATDPYAAYEVARLQYDHGDASAAAATLARLTRHPRAGLAHDLLATLATAAASQPTSASATQPAADDTRITAILAGFDDTSLGYTTAPERFIRATVTLTDRSPAPGDPWWATFELENISTVPVTLGPDAMLNPVFLVSYQMEGDEQRSYPGLVTVNLDTRRALAPHERITTTQTLDVGPPRTISRQTPQQLQRIRLDIILDPVRGPTGEWQAAPGGQTLRPLYFNRVPTAQSTETLAALFAELTSKSRTAQFHGVELLCELLGEAQRAALKRLNYRPEPIPEPRLRAALVGLLRSDDWELRVRALEGAQLVGLDQALFEAVHDGLTHENALVRLMTVRVLARQGQAFLEEARRLAANDPDDLVRQIAASYVARWTPPVPASTPAP